MGPIGSAVLTFIGYKQTDRHPDKEAKFKHKWGKFNLQTELGMKFKILPLLSSKIIESNA